MSYKVVFRCGYRWHYEVENLYVRNIFSFYTEGPQFKVYMMQQTSTDKLHWNLSWAEEVKSPDQLREDLGGTLEKHEECAKAFRDFDSSAFSLFEKHFFKDLLGCNTMEHDSPADLTS